MITHGNSSQAKKNKRDMSDAWKERISATKLMKRLEDHADGKLEKPLDATQIKSIELILQRIVPTLSAVEQTNHNDVVLPSQEELQAQLTQAIASMSDTQLHDLGLMRRPALVKTA